MIPLDNTQAIKAAQAAASQHLRRQVSQAFDRAGRAQARRRRPEPFGGQLGESIVDQVKAEAARTAQTATRARTFIFLTAQTTDDGQPVSQVFRLALRHTHPDSTATSTRTQAASTTSAGSAIDTLQQARQALKDAGLWA